MLKTFIASGQDKRNLTKVNEEGALFTVTVSDVAERPLLKPFSNSTGSNMAVNAAIGGTPSNIWDGTGVGDTGANDFTFGAGGGTTAVEDTLSMHAGTNGLNVNMPNKGRLDFTNVPTPTDMTASSTLQFWIQPQVGWITGGILEIELRYLGTRYGNKLDAVSYMADELVGTWKLVSIPLVDFGAPVGLVDEIRFKAKNTSKVFYFDDFQHGVFGGGTGVDPIYVLQPSPLERYRIEKIIITITDNSAATGTRQSWDSTNFGMLTALASGVLFTVERDWGSELTSLVFSSAASLLTYTERANEVIGVNVTSLNFNIDTNGVLLRGDTADKMKITIRDDLSGLLAFTAAAQGTARDLKET